MNDAAMILLLGAGTAPGQYFLDRTVDQHARILAVSRQDPPKIWQHATWIKYSLDRGAVDMRAATLVSFGRLEHVLMQVQRSYGLGRVVACSPAEARIEGNQLIARQEEELAQLCHERGIVLTLLKPLSLYGGSRQLPAGEGPLPTGTRMAVGGRGLRAPVHADDLARLALDCLVLGRRSVGNWLLAGGEVLSYPEMVKRLLDARGKPAEVQALPARLLRVAIRRELGDLERHARDLLVDDLPARQHLGWNPRPFQP